MGSFKDLSIHRADSGKRLCFILGYDYDNVTLKDQAHLKIY
jgi:hypothetical protein